MQATLHNGWSRNISQMQIETAAHSRQGKVTNNFAAHLALPQPGLMRQALKDLYLFDFLTLAEPFCERDLETRLIGIRRNSCWNWGRALRLQDANIVLMWASRTFALASR